MDNGFGILLHSKDLEVNLTIIETTYWRVDWNSLVPMYSRMQHGNATDDQNRKKRNELEDQDYPSKQTQKANLETKARACCKCRTS